MRSTIRQYWQGLSVPARASIVFMAVNFITEGIRFLTTPIYTRLLSPDEYGATSVFYSWESILGVFAMLSLQYGIFNNGMYEFRDKRDTFITSLLCLSNMATIILFAILGVLWPLMGQLIDLNKSLLILLFLIFIIKPAYSFWVSRQRYEYRYHGPALTAIFMAIFSPLLGILGIIFMEGDKATIKLWMSQIPFLLVWGFFYLYTYIRTRFSARIAYIKYAFQLSVPLIPHYASQYILTASDKIMVAYYVNDASAGIYSLSTTAASVVSIIWNSINAVLTPWTYEKVGVSDYRSIRNAADQLSLFYAATCTAIMLVAPEIMWVIAPASYTNAVSLIPPVIAATYLSGIFSLFGNVELFHKKVNLVMFASSAAAALNIILNFVFIKLCGFKADTYTTLACYIFYTLFHYANMRRIDSNDIYNIRHISLYSFAVISISLICTFIYPYIILRYGIILAFLTALIWNRRKIVNLIKGLRKQ